MAVEVAPIEGTDPDRTIIVRRTPAGWPVEAAAIGFFLFVGVALMWLSRDLSDGLKILNFGLAVVFLPFVAMLLVRTWRGDLKLTPAGVVVRDLKRAKFRWQEVEHITTFDRATDLRDRSRDTKVLIKPARARAIVTDFRVQPDALRSAVTTMRPTIPEEESATDLGLWDGQGDADAVATTSLPATVCGHLVIGFALAWAALACVVWFARSMTVDGSFAPAFFAMCAGVLVPVLWHAHRSSRRIAVAIDDVGIHPVPRGGAVIRWEEIVAVVTCHHGGGAVSIAAITRTGAFGLPVANVDDEKRVASALSRLARLPADRRADALRAIGARRAALAHERHVPTTIWAAFALGGLLTIVAAWGLFTTWRRADDLIAASRTTKAIAVSEGRADRSGTVDVAYSVGDVGYTATVRVPRDVVAVNDAVDIRYVPDDPSQAWSAASDDAPLQELGFFVPIWIGMVGMGLIGWAVARRSSVPVESRRSTD